MNNIKHDATKLVAILNRMILPIALCGLFDIVAWKVFNEAYWMVSTHTDWLCEVMADYAFLSALFCVGMIVVIPIANVFVACLPDNGEITILVIKKKN